MEGSSRCGGRASVPLLVRSSTCPPIVLYGRRRKRALVPFSGRVFHKSVPAQRALNFPSAPTALPSSVWSDRAAADLRPRLALPYRSRQADAGSTLEALRPPATPLQRHHVDGCVAGPMRAAHVFRGTIRRRLL